MDISKTIVDIRQLCAEISNHPFCKEFKVTDSQFIVIFPVEMQRNNRDGICINKAFNVHGQKGSLEWLLGALDDLLAITEAA